jgi:zinc protease
VDQGVSVLRHGKLKPLGYPISLAPAILALAGGLCWGAGPRLPAPQQIVLENGCRVLFQANPHSATVGVSALVLVRSSRETQLRAGIRNLLSLMAGAAQDQSGAGDGWPVSVRLESIATRDYVELLVQCLPEDFPEALGLVRKRLFELEIDSERFAEARGSALAEVEARRGSPVAFALRTSVAELYPHQRGAWPVGGSAASLSAIDVADVRRFHGEYFRPNATVVGISGNVTADEVATQARIHLGDLVPGPSRHQPEVFSPHPTLAEPRWLLMSGLDKSAVVVGGRAPRLEDEGYPAGVVLSALLGSGMGSRLFQALRAQRSLAYTIEAALTPSTVCSYAYVLATCSREDIETVRAGIESQIESIIHEGVTQEEAARAKRFVINSFVLSNQRNRDVSHYLGVFYGSGGEAGSRTYEQFTDLIEGISPPEVSRSCEQIFGRRVTVIVEANGPGPSGL